MPAPLTTPLAAAPCGATASRPCYSHLRTRRFFFAEFFQYLELKPGQVPKLMDETFLAWARRWARTSSAPPPSSARNAWFQTQKGPSTRRAKTGGAHCPAGYSRFVLLPRLRLGELAGTRAHQLLDLPEQLLAGNVDAQGQLRAELAPVCLLDEKRHGLRAGVVVEDGAQLGHGV